MQTSPVNAAPMVLQYGTQDLSQRVVPRAPEALAQHIPKFFLYTQKGPTVETLVTGSEAMNMFGTDSFDVRKPYANHSTVFANGQFAEGGQCMIKRLQPADANGPSRLLLCLDVLPAMIPVYTRNADGTFTLDANGAKIATGTKIPGYSVQWVTIAAPVAAFGASVPGTAVSYGLPTRTDTAPATTNTIYPIMELEASSFGAWANNVGIRLWAPTFVSQTSMPSKMMTNVRAYPYNFSFVQRPDALTTPSAIATQMGDNYVMTTFKPGTIDPSTDARLYVGDVLLDSYRNLTDQNYPLVYGNFGRMAFYQANLDTLLNQFMLLEKTHLVATSDFTATMNGSDHVDKYLFNIAGGCNSYGIGYETFTFASTANTVPVGVHTDILAVGGSDGTMSDTLHAGLVTNQMARYADPTDQIQEVAEHVESIIYDTGFPLATKLALCQFISVRRDTFVVLGTHDVTTGTILQASDETSIAIALRTRLQMTPESDYFGTPVMRGMIIGRSGQIRNSQYTKVMPMTYEVACKSARYMGAANGFWKQGKDFTAAPGSIVEFMYNINITWVPTTVRNKNWDAGLMWVQSYARRQYFFPAFKTVYVGDTSVLNSYLTAMAICYINKVTQAAWREFSGTDDLTNAQICQRTNEFISKRLDGRFDNRYIIVPNATVTDQDLLSGFQWTTPVDLYANNMKTVMTTYTRARRMSDYVAK